MFHWLKSQTRDGWRLEENKFSTHIFLTNRLERNIFQKRA